MDVVFCEMLNNFRENSLKKAISIVALLSSMMVNAEPNDHNFGMSFEVKIPFGKQQSDPDIVFSLAGETSVQTASPHQSYDTTTSSEMFSWGYRFNGSSTVAPGLYNLAIYNQENKEESFFSRNLLWITLGTIAGGALIYNYNNDDDGRKVKCSYSYANQPRCSY